MRYDARHSLSPELMASLASEPYLALCPELMGGLGVPRIPARIVGATKGQEGGQVLDGRARVLAEGGKDVTRAFIQGAERVLDLALAAGVTRCYLKDRSPSCAWDPGGESPGPGPGQGVLAALLSRAGLEIIEVRANAAG